MSENLTLHGYRYSVYNRIARLAMFLKGMAYDIDEINPFTSLTKAEQKLLPFGRVPTLTHGTFHLFETQAITTYIDAGFDGPPLCSSDARSTARMRQIIGIIDNYGYWSMVRQVFDQRIIRPMTGQPLNEADFETGLKTARTVLTALEGIAKEGLVLDGQTLTLADCHLAPMMDYFTMTDEGRDALKSCPALGDWWQKISTLPMMKKTDPQILQATPSP